MDCLGTLIQEEVCPWLLAFVVALVYALIATRFLIDRFSASNVVARENVRTLHKGSIPVGGGWAIVPPVLVALLVHPPAEKPLAGMMIAAGFVALALISWIDDRHHVHPGIRLAIQAVVVGTALVTMPSGLSVLPGSWPTWIERLLVALGWLWFINLFNFMDGMDGLAGVETLFIATGLLLITLWERVDTGEITLLLALAGATTGFLRHNWPPARIFLGDVGSIPLGFLLGWLLIDLAARGHLAAALLLPGYFLADATITLLRRMARGEAFWRPHRTHFYQRAALALSDHGRVLWRIILANAILLMLALASLRWPRASLSGGILVVAVLLYALSHARDTQDRQRNRPDRPSPR